MFNTAINHLFQTFDYPIVYWFLYIISQITSLYFLIFIIFAVIAGVDFRKGFLVAFIFGWTMMLTVVVKNYIDYPRPLAVDSTLNSFGGEKVEKDLSGLLPKGFFELFSEELLIKTRQSDLERTGFPSGHTTSQVSLWIGLAFLFRKRWLWIFSISFVILTMISRIFLAKHYLGDVMGGLALGLLIIGIVYYAIIKLDLLTIDRLTSGQQLFFKLPLFLLPFSFFLPAFQTGSLIGFSLAFVTVAIRFGNPVLNPSLLKRSLNVLLFFLIFLALYFLSQLTHMAKEGYFATIIFILINFVSIIVSTLISKRLGLITIIKYK